jgi:hypothetical protein
MQERERSWKMERELTLEELEQETAEFLPDRLVMCTPCYNPCNPCGFIDVSVSVNVFVCL